MGREARSKRLRKVAETGGVDPKAVYTFHITDREVAALMLHLVRWTTQKGGADMVNLARTLEEFGLREVYDVLSAPGARLTLMDFDGVQFEIISPARATVDYVLVKTDCDTGTDLAIVLYPLIERMKSVKDGSYKSPVAEKAPAMEEAEESAN